MAKVVALIDRVRPLDDWLVSDFGFQFTSYRHDRETWWASAEWRSAKFVITANLDRGAEWITVGTTVRPGSRKPLRSYHVEQVVAFLDGRDDPYVEGLETQMEWLFNRRMKILSVPVLNSEELRRWVVRSSRRLFGQRPRS
jgi:hypothetical protein